ncbi:hypothetical protein [Paenibacillus sp. GYB003]|jgi:hypothetical protein|uniref:hypothetical protein n=1 Tax=Paenibacillus sp. GYB003 TaxID=2994392 RepID=UPI002F963BD6
MARHSVTLIAVILMLCFGIFFGIELATKGMERIQGSAAGYAPQGQPAAGGVPYANAAAGQQSRGAATGELPANADKSSPSPQAGAQAPAAAKPQPQPIVADSGMNRVGNQIGDMLQTVAHGTIRTIVSLLDSIVN